jgi:hypothetical protein
MGLRGIDPALVPNAATCWWGWGAPTKGAQALPKSVVFFGSQVSQADRATRGAADRVRLSRCQNRLKRR